MRPIIIVHKHSKDPVYKQLIQAIENFVSNNQYRKGDFLPSMNELSRELDISKETVKKAYSILREKGIIESAHGKGFYISNQNDDKIKILLLFDQLSTYKQVLYSSFVKEVGNSPEITIHLHNQDVELFDHFINENLDKFDYYIVAAHFSLKSKFQKKAVKTLNKIPNRKLILLDHNIEGLKGNFGSVYQDFENDIFDCLSSVAFDLKKIKKLNVVSMSGSLYAPLVEKGISRYCTEQELNFEIHKSINSNKINKNEAYVILNSQLDRELIELIRIAKIKEYEIGKDIGIISYNESPINEIIMGGLSVFSTDFEQMGKIAAQMILDKTFRKVRCDFRLIRRNTY